MRIALLFPFFLAFLQPVFSQITFKRLYGASGNEEARYVEPLGDGSFLVAGLSGQDAVVARISGNGTVVWSRAYGGSGTDLFTQILSCSDGNFIALGETNSFGAGGVDLYIVKFDPNGNVIWERTAGGANAETARGIAEVSDGYVVTGGSQSIGAGFWDIYVEKTDFNGVTQWNRAWGGGGGDIAGQPLAAGNGEIWITGFTFISSGNHDPILFRISANGNLLSATHYSIAVNNGLNGLASGGAGMVAGGGTWVGNSHFPLIVNFNNSGGVAWARRYTVPGGNFGCLYVEPTADDGVIFAANEIQNDTPDAVIVKTNSSGDVEWAKAFPYESAGRLFHVRSVPGGGYIAVGYAFGAGRDWFILKMDAEGEVQQCCPEDVSVSSVTISPGPVNFSPAQASGAATAASPGNDGNLGLTFQDICNGPICCDPLTATIAPAPAITCNNPVVSLNGGGSTTGPGITYQWSGPGVAGGGNTLQPQVNQPGVYTLVVTETSTGCTAQASITVANLAQPPLAVAAAPVVLTCLLLEAPLNGAGSSTGPGITYQWSGPGIVSGGNTLQPLVNQPGTYLLTVTNTATGCVNSASAIVSQNIAPPNAEAGPSQQLDCDSPVVTLNGTGSSAGPGLSYQWSGPGIAAGGNTLQPLVNQAGNYTLTVVNAANGCTATDQATVVADFAIPAVQIAPTPEISCAQPQVQLDASGSSQGAGLSYTWTTPDGQIIQGANSLTPVVGAPGVYNLLIFNNQNGCVNGGSVLVSGDPTAPQANAGPGGELTCAQPQLVLQGSASGNNLAIQWTTSPGLIISGSSTLSPIAGDAGWYILTATDTLYGCVASDTVEVTEDGNVPVLSLFAANAITCSQPSAVLDGTGSSLGGPYQFSWSSNGGIFLGGTETLAPIAGSPGQYTLTIADTLNGCEISQIVEVVADTVAPAPAIAEPGMLNCFFPEITLEGTLGGAPGLDFTWTTIDGNISGNGETLQPQIDQPGLYILEVTNPQNGCSGSAEVLVDSDFEAPQADAEPGGVITCADTILTLNAAATGAGPLVFLWTSADGEIISGADTPSPQVGAAGLYQLQVTDTQNGCVAAAEAAVLENLAPPLAAAIAAGPITCATPEVQLDGSLSSAGAQYVYSWSAISGQILSGAETLSPTVGQAGIYQLVVTDTLNQCSAEVVVAVAEDLEIPLADAGADLELTCAQPQAALLGQGSQGPVFTYFWTTADGLILSGAQTLSPEAGAAGLYELVVANTQNGCAATDQVEVTFSGDIPVAAVATPPILTCVLTEVTLDASASEQGSGIIYSWTTAGGHILSGANTLNPLVGAPGSYVLAVTNTATGCIGFAEVGVSADTTAPQAQAGQDGLLTCATQLVVLNGQGSSQGSDFAYAWFTADGLIVSGGNTLSPEVAAPGMYQLTVANTMNGCAATDSVQVFQDIQTPSAVILAPDTLTCANPVIQLDATGSDSGPSLQYSWTTNDGVILSGAETLSPEVGGAGIYELLIINVLNGCSESSVVSVFQNFQAPAVEAGEGADLTCSDTLLQLGGTASGQAAALSYQWSAQGGNIVSGAQTLNPIINQPGAYFLTVTDPANGCASSDQVEIGLDTLSPSIAFAHPGVLTCSVSQIQLQASGPGPQMQFQWETIGGLLLSGAETLSPVAGAPGIYLLTVTDPQNGCQRSASVAVEQDIQPPLADAGEGFVLPCDQEDVLLSGLASSASGQWVAAWTAVGGQILGGDTGLTPLIQGGGLYFLEITDPINGCTAADSVFVSENAPFDPEILVEQPRCEEEQGQLAVAGVSGGTPPFLYSVDGGAAFQSSPVFPGLLPGVYAIVVQDALGCETLPEESQILPPQPVEITLEASAELLQGNSYQITTQLNLPDSAIQTVVWTPAAGLSCADCLRPLATPLQTTGYTLEVTDLNGCTARAAVQIVVDKRAGIFVPNIFSPNGDGENDRFFIFANDANIRQIRSFLVFDRWGEMVFEYYRFLPNNPASGWDGAFQGKPLDPAVFVWFAEIELIDGRVEVLKGGVLLSR